MTDSISIRSRRVRPHVRARRATPSPLDLGPASTYEVVTRQMVEDIAADVLEIKSRINNVFYIVIGSILVDMFTRWLGPLQ